MYEVNIYRHACRLSPTGEEMTKTHDVKKEETIVCEGTLDEAIEVSLTRAKWMHLVNREVPVALKENKETSEFSLILQCNNAYIDNGIFNPVFEKTGNTEWKVWYELKIFYMIPASIDSISKKLLKTFERQ